ncbi:MAG: pyrroline-5-carboxylate reductase [Deltaproteobacteria bacterium]|nr:MAG: pyrroline-5-carboxylate reductase [Deltaproteobacteria bacterium]
MTAIGSIGFVGGGNMAEALIKGLLAQGHPQREILVADPSPARQALLRDSYRVEVATGNREVAERCRLLVLAVKPQLVQAAVGEFAGAVTAGHLLVSILAGTATATLEGLLGGTARVVRAMPNTPALVGCGATAICPGRFAAGGDLDAAAALFRAVGSVNVVSEAQMDAVTGLSGSGPAYIFTVIEALADGGVKEGLPRDVALALATRTVLGAAKLVAESGEHPAVLRDKVCSPGGTTIAGLTALEDGGVRAALIEAVSRATRRSKELGGS